MENNQKEQGNRKLMIVIIIALLLVTGVSLYFVFAGKQDLMATSAEKTSLDSSFHSLTDTLDARNAAIDQFTKRNTQLDSAVATSQQMIASQKQQLSALLGKNKMTKKELDDAKAKLKEFETNIADLQKQIVDLTAQNAQLTQQNQALSTDLNNEKQTTAALSNQNQNLGKKVLLSQLLQLNNIEVAGIKKRENGKEVVEHKIKSVESLRITFETGVNKNLNPGTLQLYVRIINPKGETIYQPNQGSGSFTSATDNSSMQYTKEADFDYNQSNKKVIVYWTQNVTSAGIYKVELYQSGYLVGKGQVELK